MTFTKRQSPTTVLEPPCLGSNDLLRLILQITKNREEKLSKNSSHAVSRLIFIEPFHSRSQQPWKFIGTREST